MFGFGFIRKEKTDKKFYLIIKEPSKAEIIKALKEKKAMWEGGWIPLGVIIEKKKSKIPFGLLEDLLELKIIENY